MSNLIDRQAAIESISKLFHPIGGSVLDEDDKKRYDEGVDDALQEIEELPSAQPEITLESAIDYLHSIGWMQEHDRILTESAQPEQRYTEEELRVFAHGISLSLLSKRSAQHWRYDKDTATEIEFLERLYDKVSADMKGGQG